MSRTRLSTTVDADLLECARRASGKPDSALVDDALAALLARHRAAEVDASYTAYDVHPLDEPDEWGTSPPFDARSRPHDAPPRARGGVVV